MSSLAKYFSRERINFFIYISSFCFWKWWKIVVLSFLLLLPYFLNNDITFTYLNHLHKLIYLIKYTIRYNKCLKYYLNFVPMTIYDLFPQKKKKSGSSSNVQFWNVSNAHTLHVNLCLFILFKYFWLWPKHTMYYLKTTEFFDYTFLNCYKNVLCAATSYFIWSLLCSKIIIHLKANTCLGTEFISFTLFIRHFGWFRMY